MKTSEVMTIQAYKTIRHPKLAINVMGSLLNPFKWLQKISYLQLYLPLLPFYKYEVIRMNIVLALEV